jgi:hypothetical protein
MLLVKRILHRYKYPPEMEPQALGIVLRQAEILSEAWVLNPAGDSPLAVSVIR